MNHWLLWPPVVFLLILCAALILLRGMSVFSFPAKDGAAGGKRKAYACGEDMPASRGQPDYSQFFPFAFFFTIMHVLTLVVATVPARDWPAIEIAAGYLLCSLIGLFILFRR
jgi:NADH:ubiquinone oxidoreductase subunit 3 (subunit A)